jgi:hypothetical protein
MGFSGAGCAGLHSNGQFLCQARLSGRPENKPLIGSGANPPVRYRDVLFGNGRFEAEWWIEE